MTIEYEDYLAHHGIKGQKWGIRRFQNEDGSLTEEGRRRYGIDDRFLKNVSEREQISKSARSDGNVSQRRKELESEYLNAGLDEDAARAEAIKRERLENFVKIAGGIAIGAVAAYATYRGAKYIQRVKDVRIRKGVEIGRIATRSSEGTDHPVYVAFDKNDRAKYKGLLGSARAMQLKNGYSGDGVYEVKMQAAKGMKIAGERKGKQVFDQLMKNDGEFRSHFHNLENGGAGIQQLKGKRSDYDFFNLLLAGNSGDPEHERMKNKFYTALKNKGYSGVIDTNDRRFSGYNTKNPVILFDYADKISKRSMNKLDFNDIYNAEMNAYKLLYRQQRRSAVGETAARVLGNTGRLAAPLVGVGLGSIAANEASARSDTAKQKKLIDAYKDEYPNTKLTDREILNMLLRK